MQPEGNRRRPQRVVGLCALVQSDVRVRSCVCTIVRTGAHVSAHRAHPSRTYPHSVAGVCTRHLAGIAAHAFRDRADGAPHSVLCGGAALFNGD